MVFRYDESGTETVKLVHSISYCPLCSLFCIVVSFRMGSSESKVNFRRSIVELEAGNQGDDAFWEAFWASEGVTQASDVWALVPAGEVRALREDHPSLLATLCYRGLPVKNYTLSLIL